MQRTIVETDLVLAHRMQQRKSFIYCLLHNVNLTILFLNDSMGIIRRNLNGPAQLWRRLDLSDALTELHNKITIINYRIFSRHLFVLTFNLNRLLITCSCYYLFLAIIYIWGSCLGMISGQRLDKSLIWLPLFITRPERIENREKRKNRLAAISDSLEFEIARKN